MSNAISGNYNTAYGYQAAQNLSSGTKNAYFGDNAGGLNTTGGENTMVGTVAGQFNNGGNTNTMIGGGAGRNNLTGSGNVFLGYSAGENETGSNRLYIANSNTSSPLIYGNFSNGSVTVHDSLISKYFQMTKGAGNGYILQSDANGNGSWVNPSTSLVVAGNGLSYSGTTLNSDWTTSGTNIYNNNTGYVGIGTASPAYELDVVGQARITHGGGGSSGGVVIVDNNNAGISFERSGNGTDQKWWDIITGAPGFEFRAVNDANSSATMFMEAVRGAGTAVTSVDFPNSNVGIGTASPAVSLDVASSGTGNFTTVAQMLAAGNTTTNNYTQIRVGVANTAYNSGELRFQYNGSGSTSNIVQLGLDGGSGGLSVNGNGYVGIGTTNPTQGLLVVSGNVSASYTYHYLSSSGTGGPSTNSIPVSIYASDRIVASEFDAISDARIKHVICRTDNDTDLNTLISLQITNYRFIDTIAKGNKEFKKVIAQEVEKVYPNAVSKQTDIVPDIYQLAEMKAGRISLNNTLKTGDRVKLITPDKTDVFYVTAADNTGFNVDLQLDGKVFVYGREVKDFRSVDYEALTTLNISATQALVKMVNDLQKENSEVKTKLASVTGDVEAIKQALQLTTKAQK